MHVLLAKNDLVTLIGYIQGIIPSKPAIPILVNVRLEAEGDTITISASDLAMSMKASIPAKVIEEGVITLPAKKLFQLIRELSSAQVEIKTEAKDIASVKSGTSDFKIPGLVTDEFPTFPAIEGTKISISTIALKEMFVRTAFAAARTESRHVLNGVEVRGTSNILSVVGTDGKRLAKLITKTDISEPIASVIPLQAVDEMIKMLDPTVEMATLTIMVDKVALEVGAVQFVSQVIVGQYPDVNRVIPERQKEAIPLHREELMSLLKQVALFTSEDKPSVRFQFSNGLLNLDVASKDIGEGKVNMPINYQGESFEIAFNPSYFLDILRHTKDELVQFSANSPFNPGLITDSSDAIFVIMPMRLDA